MSIEDFFSHIFFSPAPEPEPEPDYRWHAYNLPDDYEGSWAAQLAELLSLPTTEPMPQDTSFMGDYRCCTCKGYYCGEQSGGEPYCTHIQGYIGSPDNNSHCHAYRRDYRKDAA